jgi:non-canonical (house-cleaning) NTP pyrophosphatase
MEFVPPVNKVRKATSLGQANDKILSASGVGRKEMVIAFFTSQSRSC